MGRAASPARAFRKRPAAADRPLRDAALDANRPAAAAQQMHAVARRGVSGTAGSYPYGNLIGEAFGRYTPPALSAHVGQAAREAGAALSAEAFVWNGKAAFAGRPSLRIAAHEAAHMVHQAAGVDLRHGVGARGDGGERLADRVADTTAAGRSAEPVFEAALGPEVSFAGAAPALQMFNHIKPPSSPWPQEVSPWTRIETQLGVKAGILDAKLTALGYGTMLTTLGKLSARADTVVAVINDGRSGGPRAGDPTQSAYGALGNFMSRVTGTNTPTNMEFQGGHLISDEILGDQSYVQYNFAPQRRHFNTPIYRTIETIARGGIAPLTPPPAHAKKPEATMTVKLGYESSPLALDPAHVMTNLNLQPSDLRNPAALPPKVYLTHRVPRTWEATIDAGDPNYVFKRESTINPPMGSDPLSRSGAAKGFLDTRLDVEHYEADALTHPDTIFWWMDSMMNPVVGKPGLRGTGSAGNRRRTHTFFAVQSVPTGKNRTYGAISGSLTPPKALPLVTLGTAPLTFSEFKGISWGSAITMTGKLISRYGGLKSMFRNAVTAAAYQVQLCKRNNTNPSGTILINQAGSAMKDRHLKKPEARTQAGLILTAIAAKIK